MILYSQLLLGSYGGKETDSVFTKDLKRNFNISAMSQLTMCDPIRTTVSQRFH